MRPGDPASLRPHLVARTAFFDRAVLRAVTGGTQQIVVAGAGYDDRALRFRASGVHFYELDHPATQADKRRRLRRMRADLDALTLVPVDFRVNDAGAALDAVGHDAGRPTLFICEGLLVYLDRRTVHGLLAALRSRAGTGSTLAASLAVHRRGVDSAAVVAAANAGRPNAAAEPWRTILPARAHLDLLRSAGWFVAGSIDDARLGTGARPNRSLLVTARPAGDRSLDPVQSWPR